MSKQAVKPMADAIEASVEQLSNLKRSLSIVVPVNQIDEKEEQEFKKLAQNAQVKGYRQGKVPRTVLKKRFAQSVHGEVIKQLINESLSMGLKKYDLKPVGPVQFESIEAEMGQPLKMKVTFEVSPTIEVMDISQLSLKKFNIEITDADLNEKLESLRLNHATWLPTEKAAEKGNQIKIDYEGQLNGESFSGGSNKNMTLRIGDEVMFADFENQLIGAKAGDELSFDVTFPSNYGIKELEGKTVNFKVKVHEVAIPQLPELDDNFAKKLDVPGGLEALKQKLKEFMENDIIDLVQENLKHQIVEQLVKHHPLDLPSVMVEAEIKNMQERAKHQLSGILKKDFPSELSSELFKKEADKKVAIGLIFSELVKKFNIKPSPENLEKKIESMAATYNVETEVLKKWLATNEGAYQQITFAVLEDQVIQTILEHAKIENVPTSYHEAIEWKQNRIPEA